MRLVYVSVVSSLLAIVLGILFIPSSIFYSTTGQSVILGLFLGLLLSSLPFLIIVYTISATRSKKVKAKLGTDDIIDYHPTYVKLFERTLKALVEILEKEKHASSVDIYSRASYVSPVVDNIIASMKSQQVPKYEIEKLEATLLVTLLINIILHLPSPLLRSKASSEWSEAASLADADREMCIHVMRKKVSNLPLMNRHLLLLILRHIYTMEHNFKIDIELMLPLWSEALWPSKVMEPSDAGLKVK